MSEPFKTELSVDGWGGARVEIRIEYTNAQFSVIAETVMQNMMKVLRMVSVAPEEVSDAGARLLGMLMMLRSAGDRGLPGRDLAPTLGVHPKGIGNRLAKMDHVFEGMRLKRADVIDFKDTASCRLWRLGVRGEDAIARLDKKKTGVASAAS